jgi:hypothetical protein
MGWEPPQAAAAAQSLAAATDGVVAEVMEEPFF